MKIIFSPSKEMDFSKKSVSSFYSQIKPLYKSEKIYEMLIQLSAEEISKRFKIKKEMLAIFMKDLENHRNSYEKSGIEAYAGVAFRQLLVNDYTEENFKYVYDHLRILSAFYGFTRGTDLIKKHRIDFTVKVFDEISLYKYWNSYVNEELEEGEIIFNLASGEYSKLINGKRVTIVNFEFYENDSFKQISTNSKKARGQLLNLLIQNNVQNINDVKNLKMFDYRLREELSGKNKFVFIKK